MGPDEDRREPDWDVTPENALADILAMRDALLDEGFGPPLTVRVPTTLDGEIDWDTLREYGIHPPRKDPWWRRAIKWIRR